MKLMCGKEVEEEMKIEHINECIECREFILLMTAAEIGEDWKGTVKSTTHLRIKE